MAILLLRKIEDRFVSLLIYLQQTIARLLYLRVQIGILRFILQYILMIELGHKLALGDEIIDEIQYPFFEMNGEWGICTYGFERCEIEAADQLPYKVSLIYIVA